MIRALLVTLLLFASTAHGETLTNPLLAKNDICGRFELYHINGVLTDPEGAQANTDRIRAVYGNAHNGHLILYKLAYNQKRGFITDFMDSAKQIINLYAMATWDKWMSAVTFGIYSAGMDAATTKAIATAVVKAWGFTKPNPYQDQEMNEIMLVIQQTTAPGAKIMLAPHSQGNFYASLVYDKLIALNIKPAKSIGVVGLAVPYSSVRGGNSYLTSANDVIIDGVRIPTLNNVLSPTHTIPYAPLTDPFGHNLVATYMAHGNTRTAYISLLLNKFNGLKTTLADPPQWIRFRSWGMVCGKYGVPGPQPCYYDVPYKAYPQWWENVNINMYSTMTTPVHAFGTPADLVAPTQALASGCYSQFIADRKAVITAAGYVPTSQWYWPAKLLGQCGYGFPWQTPYGNPDVAWNIYSADTSKTTVRNWTDPPDSYYTDVEIFPVCKR